MPDSNGDVLVQVCIECGREYTFEEEPPDDLVCDRCGNTVFRSFHSSDGMDEVERDFDESTARDLRPDDPEGDVTRGDLHDLERF